MSETTPELAAAPVAEPTTVPTVDLAPAAPPVADITAAPVADTTAVDPAVDLAPGAVVFFDASIFGVPEKAVFAGLVLESADGRTRVHALGLARVAADFPTADLRLQA
jgi:hypothetical protein